MGIKGCLVLQYPLDKPFSERAQLAVNHYRKKHGRTPNVCYVNKAELDAVGGVEIDGVRVASRDAVMVGYFYVGEEAQ